ncbi:sugar phosphate isomerase/epimerase [Thermococcus indicus]|uniref:Sugar phosphate isomerase/epimerase n=1 Tax=Thermococcus indicus TaxID=2586643 RepID=A0A4Y5SLU4_9EURY|nr:sugar phosphate isomerase/epimerase family protein [Thermococcus indicus]QDA31142.1 sugar phosphate isomerase/epimerase [Thermococcus indicus]
MKLGITSSLVMELSGKGLSIDELGVSLVEVYMDDLPLLVGTSVDWGLVREISSLGIQLTVHAPTHTGKFSALDLGVKSGINIKTVERVMQIASSLDALKVVIHGGRIGKNYHRAYLNTKRQLEIIGSIADDFGVPVMLENLFGPSVGILPPELMSLLEPDMGICFDFGHAFLTAMELGINMDEFLTLCPMIDHLHIHDNNGSRDDHLPPGKGLIGIKFVKKVIETARPSTGILEVRNYSSLEEILRAIQVFENIPIAAR